MTKTNGTDKNKNLMQEVYFFLMEEILSDGTIVEGTVTVSGGNSMIPLFTSDRSTLREMKRAAKRIARQSGMKVKLVKFSNREVIYEDILKSIELQ
jgi:hypothetical protein